MEGTDKMENLSTMLTKAATETNYEIFMEKMNDILLIKDEAEIAGIYLELNEETGSFVFTPDKWRHDVFGNDVAPYLNIRDISKPKELNVNDWMELLIDSAEALVLNKEQEKLISVAREEDFEVIPTLDNHGDFVIMLSKITGLNSYRVLEIYENKPLCIEIAYPTGFDHDVPNYEEAVRFLQK